MSDVFFLDLGLKDRGYALVTLHRPSNVDADADADATLSPIVGELLRILAKIPTLFVAHPRTIRSLKHHGHCERLTGATQLTLLDPCPTSIS